MDRRDFVRLSAAGVLSYANTWRAVTSAAPGFGYASITWNGDDVRAIDEIAGAGYRGIQLRSAAVDRWKTRPAELAALLSQRGLTFVALSSGAVSLNPAQRAATVAQHVANAQFLNAAGGLYLQVVDERPATAPAAADYRYMGSLLTEIGQRVADVGVTLGLHNHMGNLSQSANDVAQVLDASDARVVKLELDIAHWHAAGGDPVDAVRRYADRLLFLHLKDLQRPAPGGAPASYRFVELGQGSVNVRGVVEALRQVGFSGWCIVELDGVTSAERSAAQSAALSRRYLESIGVTL
jgi:inosose dehydratase